jgi:hypothetical protein
LEASDHFIAFGTCIILWRGNTTLGIGQTLMLVIRCVSCLERYDILIASTVGTNPLVNITVSNIKEITSRAILGLSGTGPSDRSRNLK